MIRIVNVLFSQVNTKTKHCVNYFCLVIFLINKKAQTIGREKIMKNRKMLIGALVTVGVLFGLLAHFANQEQTPFKEGSGEWVGYTAAEANGFKRVEDCTSDPETVKLEGFAVGCKKWLEKAK